MVEFSDADADFLREHMEAPYNRGRLKRPTCAWTERNAACGDQVHLELEIGGGCVRRAYFDGHGCLISQAAASILCQHVEGRSLDQLRNFRAEDMLHLIRIPLTPRRWGCALLAFVALKKLVGGFDERKLEQQNQ